MSKITKLEKGTPRYDSCVAVFGEEMCDSLSGSLGTVFNKAVKDAMDPIKQKLMKPPASMAAHYFKLAACKESNPFFGGPSWLSR